MTKKAERNKVIKRMAASDVRAMVRDHRFFATVLSENKGFVESAVLSVIGGKRDHADYDDLVQIGRHALWKAAKKYDKSRSGSSSFSTYAFRVIQNAARQELKILNRRRKKDVSLERFASRGQDGERTGGEYNESVFSDGRNRGLAMCRGFEDAVLTEMVLADRMEGLTEYERAVFRLRFLDGKGLRQVADAVGTNFHTLRQWYYRDGKPKFDEILREVGA